MRAKWVTFTRRTNDQKLAWLEKQLDAAKISHRRHGESVHAPILQVPGGQLDQAWKILDPVDDLPDDLTLNALDVLDALRDALKPFESGK